VTVSGKETSNSTDKIVWLWKQIEIARQDRDPERAREGLERLLADPAVRQTADENLAVLYICQLELDEGRTQEVVQRMDGFNWYGLPGPAALLLSADIFLRLEWFDRAKDSLEEYLKVFPEDLDARRKLGLVLLMMNDDTGAEKLLLAVARREKHNIPATLTYLAMLEAKKGRLEESLHLLLEARDLSPSDRHIEHTLLRIEALRVSLKRRVMTHNELPMEDVVAGMVSGMLNLHGYSDEKASQARCIWHDFCEKSSPRGRKPGIWAAALEYAVTKSGPHFTQEQLASEYGVSASQLRDHYHELSTGLDLTGYLSGDLLSETEQEGTALSRMVRREELAEILAGVTHHFHEFDSPGEAVSWVFDRVIPGSEAERREIEEFVGFLWCKKGR
jgi:tetratricopeptide (TPR) repeat protein